MSASITTPQTQSLRPTAGRWAEFRLIPQIDTLPWAVAFAQTVLGRVILLSVFGLELLFFDSGRVVLFMLLTLALITFMPEYRRFVLAVSPLCFLLVQTADPVKAGLSLAVVAVGILLFWVARRWPKSRFGRRPIVFLLSGFSLLILLACTAKPQTLSYKVIWQLVAVWVSYVWFIGYALMDRSANPSSDTSLELATFRPLWGSTATPFPKGAAYLRRIESRDAPQLAVVQLKGLKLLAWVILLALLQSALIKLFHGFLRIPTSAQALAMSVHGTPAAWHLRWESQILFFFEVTLSFAIMGNKFIATCRLAGFNAMRNSYRPLSSTTIAEFFNRFYYYFKELLVDFFFYPAFLRYWKEHRRLRTIFATFVAIAFGNSFFHLTRDWQFFQDRGVWRGLLSYQVLFFYNILMAAGVAISQLRQRGPKAKGFIRGRLIPVLGVISFYCVLSVFGDEDRLYPLTVHLRYLASLFFIGS